MFTPALMTVAASSYFGMYTYDGVYRPGYPKRLPRGADIRRVEDLPSTHEVASQVRDFLIKSYESQLTSDRNCRKALEAQNNPANADLIQSCKKAESDAEAKLKYIRERPPGTWPLLPRREGPRTSLEEQLATMRETREWFESRNRPSFAGVIESYKKIEAGIEREIEAKKQRNRP